MSPRSSRRRLLALALALPACAGGALPSLSGGAADLAADGPDLGSGLPSGELPAYHPYAACGTLVQPAGEGGEQGSRALAFSPDGKILLAGGARAHAWVVADGTLRATLDGAGGAAAFSPDGARVVASRGVDPGLAIFDGARFDRLSTIEAPAARVVAVAYAPDGATVAAGTESGIDLVRVDDGAVLRTLPLVDRPPLGLTFSPDGAWLASVVAEQGVDVLRLDGGSPHRVSGTARSIHALAFHPDGRRILIAEAFDLAARVYALADWSEEAPLPASLGSVRSVAVTSDGALAAVGEVFGRVTVLRLGDRAQLQVIVTGDRADGAGLFGVAFSPDGTVLATSASSGTVRLWCAAP